LIEAHRYNADACSVLPNANRMCFEIDLIHGEQCNGYIKPNLGTMRDTP